MTPSKSYLFALAVSLAAIPATAASAQTASLGYVAVCPSGAAGDAFQDCHNEPSAPPKYQPPTFNPNDDVIKSVFDDNTGHGGGGGNGGGGGGGGNGGGDRG